MSKINIFQAKHNATDQTNNIQIKIYYLSKYIERN